MNSDIFLQIQSFLVLVILTLGVQNRKNRKRHVPLMISAILLDLVLVVQVEIARSVLNSAVKIQANDFITNIHITIASLTAVFYVLIVISGIRLLRGHTTLQPLHKKFGWTTFALRILTFGSSFMASSPL